jgi:hypothetical protein
LQCQVVGVPLTTISATTPSIGDALAQLISGGSGGSLTPAAASADSASPSTAASTGNSGPATVVTLSDQAKAAAATAQSDQVAADNLQAYVEAHRVTGNASQAAPAGSLQSILEANAASTATPPADAQPTTGSNVEAIVAQIQTLADANEPPPFQSFTPTKSLSNSLTVDGYTLTLDTNAGTQFYGFDLSGSGFEAVNDHFGPSDGFSGGQAPPPGVTLSGEYSVGNNEAEDSITVTTDVAASSTASVSSSSGSTSTSSVNAQSSSITFLVNYATGQISAEGSAASVSARSTAVGPPGSTLSTLA